jgi:hypothetical protein
VEDEVDFVVKSDEMKMEQWNSKEEQWWIINEA